jgi:hypothetical protein
VPWKLLKQDLYCGCGWITIRPVLLVVGRCSQAHRRLAAATNDNIVRRMRFACGITEATDSHVENVIFIAFPRQKLLCERASMLRLHAH